MKVQNFSATEFRQLLANVVEIIYGSFYAAADNQGSLRHLEAVLQYAAQHGVQPPAASLFINSLFVDEHGWGKKLSEEERDAWRRASTL